MSHPYPPTPRSDLVDVLHGIAVPDPFRSLEDADDPATRAWVDAENGLTRRVLDTPQRDRLVARLHTLHRVQRSSVPVVRGSRIFVSHHDGARNQAVLVVVDMAAEDRAFRVLVDPNAIDADGTTAVTAFEPDDAGHRVVYGLSHAGSDMQELRVVDVQTRADLVDRLARVKFASIAWWEEGFFYTRYPEGQQYFCEVWYHRIGTDQQIDQLVYSRPDAAEVVFDVNVTSDARFLIVTSRRGASDDAEVHALRLEEVRAEGFRLARPRAIVTGFHAGWHFIDGRGDDLLFRTDADAPLGRIVRVSLGDEPTALHVVIPESDVKLEHAAVSGGRLVVGSLRNASSRLTSCGLDGGDMREILLPRLGSIVGIGARWEDPCALVTFTSFTQPPTVMVCDAGALQPLGAAGLPFDPTAYVTEQVWYESKDHTRISMFLVARREPIADGPARGCTLLTGYGGFNISLTPTFDPSDFLWLDAGGTIAVANLRGGGEYGDAWHRAGMRERKQTVFDDFIAAAEWLRASGRASRTLAIEGGSNGGLLVGAVMVQRPELFDVVICRVPVADMLRYHRFTVGRFWIPEYGCADDPRDLPFLLRYSPYHNVRDDVLYPPTLIMTADTDDRVAPGMAKKFAARLQEAAATEGGPILLRVETRAGHGAGKPITKQIDEQADIYAFVFEHLTRASANEHERRTNAQQD